LRRKEERIVLRSHGLISCMEHITNFIHNCRLLYHLLLLNATRL
jgi:hypothetical protein